MKFQKLVGICLIALSPAFFISCGKHTKSSDAKTISQTSSLINSKNYESAISVLESDNTLNKDSVEYLSTLSEAYAGASGFNAQDFKNIVKKISLDKLKNCKLNEKLCLIDQISELQRQLPRLSQKQFIQINTSIKLHKQLSEKLKFDKEINFQRGALHAYRAMARLEMSLSLVKDYLGSSEFRLDNSEDIKKILSSFKYSFEDMVIGLQCLDRSYDKIAELPRKVERLLQKVAKDPKIKIDFKNQSENLGSLVDDFIVSNKASLSKIAANFIKDIQDHDISGRVEAIIHNVFNKEDTKKRLQNMEIISRMFIEIVKERRGNEYQELKNILDESTIQKIEFAVKESMNTLCLDPIKKLQDDLSLRSVTNAINIILDDAKNMQLDVALENDTRAILAYFELAKAEAIKSEIQASIAKADSQIDKLEKNNENKLKRINKVIDGLDSILGSVAKSNSKEIIDISKDTNSTFAALKKELKNIEDTL